MVRHPPGKRRRKNIVRNIAGPSPLAKRTVDEVGMWELFFTNEILNKNETHTNENIDRYITANAERIDFQKYTYVKHLDMIELWVYIGITYLRAANKKNLISVEELFMHESLPRHFLATMMYRRFYSCLTFCLSRTLQHGMIATNQINMPVTVKCLNC